MVNRVIDGRNLGYGLRVEIIINNDNKVGRNDEARKWVRSKVRSMIYTTATREENK